MTTSAYRPPRRALWLPILAGVVTYAITRIVFALLGFRFSLFERPIDGSKLAIDFGAWVVVFVVTMWVLKWAAARSGKR